MFLPNSFRIENSEKIRNLITENPFATVLSFPKDENCFVNHLPVVFSTTPGEENTLIGHMSKQNPQWLHFKSNPTSTFIFHGPHTYITPKWYKSENGVPTWNYTVVHLYGKIELVEEFQGQIEILKQLWNTFENNSEDNYAFSLPSDLKTENELCAAIVSFKFFASRIDAKFKLSQNRSSQDFKGVLNGLETERTDEMSRAILKMMKNSQNYP
jgi:transcriptional regulator